MNLDIRAKLAAIGGIVTLLVALAALSNNWVLAVVIVYGMLVIGVVVTIESKDKYRPRLSAHFLPYPFVVYLDKRRRWRFG